jgi:hypothetical protein
MGAFKLFAIISSTLLSCSTSVALVGWHQVSYQSSAELIVIERNNWKPVLQTANDRIFDLKVEAGIVPAPVS